MSAPEDLDLPPLQECVLDHLGARHRLGERLWTFSSRTAPALRALEARGLVHMMSGITERTVRASLTDEGRAHALSATYESPLEAEVRRLRQDAKRLLRERNEARDALIAAN